MVDRLLEFTEVRDHTPFGENIFWGEGLLNGEPVTSGLLPASLCSPTPRNFEQRACGFLIICSLRVSYRLI